MKPKLADRILDALPDVLLICISKSGRTIERHGARLRRSTRRAYIRRAALKPEVEGLLPDTHLAELDALDLEEQEVASR